MRKKVLKYFSVSSLTLIFLGSLSWAAVMVKSGWRYSYGLGFWGPNGHDGVWHLALARGLAKGNLQNPVFSGFPIQNYHLGFDFFLALINRITKIPINNLYFHIIPPLLAVLVGILTYKFVLVWIGSKKSAFWSTFFVYFGGSFAWILGKGESAFWSQQAISTLINPPFAFSLVFILTGLIFLLKKKNLLSILFFAFLVKIKIYAGILVLVGLLASGVYSYIKNRNLQIPGIFAVSLLISLLFIAPTIKVSSKLLIFRPFWFLETMMGLSDRIGWEKFYSAMVNYRSGGVWLKMVFAYTASFVIFLLGNIGTRILAFKKFRLNSSMSIFFWSIIATGIIIPTFFLQKGTPWNTIQFFYYSLFFLAILSGTLLCEFDSKMQKHLLFWVVILTIPTTIITLRNIYLPSRPPSMLPNDEIAALNFLSDQPSGVVLTYPFNKLAAKRAETKPPRPLYLYVSTAYVSAYSGHTVFLEDEINLDITGYDWRKRRLEVENWYKQSNRINAREFLKANKIKYIYWLKGQRAYLGETQLGLIKIFENAKVDIYKVSDTQIKKPAGFTPGLDVVKS